MELKDFASKSAVQFDCYLHLHVCSNSEEEKNRTRPDRKVLGLITGLFACEMSLPDLNNL